MVKLPHASLLRGPGSQFRQLAQLPSLVSAIRADDKSPFYGSIQTTGLKDVGWDEVGGRTISHVNIDCVIELTSVMVSRIWVWLL
jgi:hypothetical protein